LRDFFFTHLGWMPLVMEKDESLNPMNIAFFGLGTVVPRPDRLPGLVEQLGLWRGGRVGVPFLILSPPSITANGWLMALLALTVSIMTALLGDPTCRSDCFSRNSFAVFSAFPRRDGWIGFRPHCIKTPQKKNFRSLLVSIVQRFQWLNHSKLS
jgi:hypothetical protein